MILTNVGIAFQECRPFLPVAIVLGAWEYGLLPGAVLLAAGRLLENQKINLNSIFSVIKINRVAVVECSARSRRVAGLSLTRRMHKW